MQAETVAHVDDRGVEAGPGGTLNTSRAGSALPPMPSGWISSEGLPSAIDGQIFEHVRAEHLHAARDEMVGVVFHERRAAAAVRRP